MRKKSVLKIAILLLITALSWTGLSAVMKTASDYNDTENSNGNAYQTGVIDFSLSSPTTNFIPLLTVSNMMPGNSVTREISVIKETDSNPFQYKASVVQTGGSTDFCNSLKLEAKLEGVTKYTDGLLNFNLDSPITIGGDGKDDWSFTVTMPTGTVFSPGDVCQIKFVFYGWQTNLSESQGFFDQEEISSSFAAGGIKINKVYYDVDAAHGVEGANEWIEIYNPLDNPVDISGWIIQDNFATDTIPTSSPIPSHGFAIITGSSTTLGYWNIPNDVVKIILADGKIGNGLNDDSDRVIFRTSSGIEDDAMSYGTDIYAFDPPCPDVNEGHILARIPTGLDTNQASDWKNLGLPQVTVVFPNGGEVLWVGLYYDLKWTAINQNGTNSALSIDIWYSKDSGQSWANIVKGTENDGIYNWRVPLCLDDGNGGCYYVPSSHARIKVVATGPENFMVQAWDKSDNDFCPPIDYDALTPEEKEILKTMGITVGEGGEEEMFSPTGEPTIELGTTTEEITTTTEEVATTTEETSTTTENPAVEIINEIISMGSETSQTTTAIISTTTNDGTTENTTTETASTEQTPVIEEQSVVTPENNSSGNSTASVENGSDASGGSVDSSSAPAPVDLSQPPASE